MSDEHWRAIDTVLSWPKPSARLPREDRLRARLRETLDCGHEGGSEAIERLRRIADGEPAETVAATPAVVAEDIAYVRCVAERPEETPSLLTMRSYLEDAVPGPQSRDLLIDRAATLEQLSFVILLTEPHRFDATRAAFEAYHAAYASDYARHHQRYWRAFATLSSLLEDAAPAADALGRLNTLRSLGKPAGTRALKEYRRFVRAPGECDVPDLAAVLRDEPVCSTCRVTMPDGAPAEEVEEVLRRLHRALAWQQTRLASEAVRRIIARGSATGQEGRPERIEQFLQIVQASDLAGLAQVLDDELLAFLRDLLAEPVTPAPDALDLLDQLVRAHPVVSEGQIDAAAQTLRTLLIERLQSERDAHPARPPVVRLAGPAEPS